MNWTASELEAKTFEVWQAARGPRPSGLHRMALWDCWQAWLLAGVGHEPSNFQLLEPTHLIPMESQRDILLIFPDGMVRAPTPLDFTHTPRQLGVTAVDRVDPNR